MQLSLPDQGPDIPPGDLESSFEPFMQSSRTRDGSGGTGLGLTVCHKIMRAHDGYIEATNAIGDGGRAGRGRRARSGPSPWIC